MRPLIVGLFCALIGAFAVSTMASAASIDAGAKAKGMAAAPGLVAAAHIDCQPADAYYVGDQEDPKTHAKSSLYEIACKDFEGGIVISHADKTAEFFSCLEMANAPKGSLMCQLPENANPAAGLQSVTAKVNPGCTVDKARALGQTPDGKQIVFEIVCADGDGFIMNASNPISAAQPVTLQPCLAFAGGQGITCTLTTQASQLARIDALAAQANNGCQVKDRRYILTTDDGANYYEVACQDGKGYVLQQAPNGSLVKTIGCANANYVGGGCTLTNARQAQSEEADVYTKLARAAGFDCAVSKYAPFDAGTPGHEVVELSCSNRPDGAIGVFAASASEPGKIYPCAESELEGYRCGLTPAEAGYPLLTADLKKLGKASCTVSADRVAGVTADKVGIIEVACADGGLGYMMEYNTTPLSPKDAVPCAFAGGIAGGCRLPGNAPKKG